MPVFTQCCVFLFITVSNVTLGDYMNGVSRSGIGSPHIPLPNQTAIIRYSACILVNNEHNLTVGLWTGRVPFIRPDELKGLWN